ncbi:uncharacterized protein SPPG_03060 [Spizellomyces punctatus DAOM BR117]|uniref:Cation/H+ exchanger transmembrane domain-containing protein n=1 Tax=Spizellomyces punctatus (strain DAOM BR117) TaxID=645134 RepID=A0A0L0HNF6_SPIPD|nr:uncharacterized protein SPPG_03060 [Spizellomyces punctatus DAOM BR117]KND02607.1 hypothetical protein SPPG_03060 [Spizellomyces punctatus DAOM BR117]|eukprot:XP_016610646.1 hypothetical protein SPPG_03060 [Spizellomyces punctatus DAOM BR117]
MSAAAFLFQEVPVSTILILLGFLVLLNFARTLFTIALRAGLVGEIAIGLVFGTPLLDLLGVGLQETFAALGYLGLLSIVFEGGLGTNLKQAKRNIGLSLLVGTTGICLPIVTCILFFHFGFSSTFLQGFTAGAALSATSLGTTFSILEDAGLTKTRVGTVLISAAMFDDVVGLVISQVVHGLAQDAHHGANAIGWQIGRPILASAGLLLVTYVLVKVGLLILPALLARMSLSSRGHQYWSVVALFILLVAFIAISSYSGTSHLLGTFLAGISLRAIESGLTQKTGAEPHCAPSHIFERHIRPIQEYVFAPLFFATIGFAIPIRTMFDGETLWMGLVLTVLMTVAKWLSGISVLVWNLRPKENLMDEAALEIVVGPNSLGEFNSTRELVPMTVHENANLVSPEFKPDTRNQKDVKLLPLMILGFSMVSRGEIGLLIANIAYPSVLDERLFKVSIWAVLLCTIIGPFAVGHMVKSGVVERLGKWG